MEYDIIYPEKESRIRSVACVVAASYFYPEQLIEFGVDEKALEVTEPFVDENEFEKVFRLWESPMYLRNFFKENKDYFQDEYWEGITEEYFVRDVLKSLNIIKGDLLDIFNNNELGNNVEPLDKDEEDLRLHNSIRVKIKKGWIHRRLAFRFYAVEIEENKCYLITGAAIKIHKDMGKAPNTKIEKKKLEFVLNNLEAKGINTKELFIDFFFDNYGRQ